MKRCRLGDILDVKRGMSLSGEYYSETGEKIRLTLGNFNYPGGGFKENTSKNNLYFLGDVKKEFLLKKGDIITPLTEQTPGLLGETARIPQDNLYIQSGDIGLVLPFSDTDSNYAYYLLSSSSVKKQLAAGAQQTKIRHTSPDSIKNCVVFVPELEQQKRIGLILNNIDKKISINNCINDNLEQMLSSIYTYYFIQHEDINWNTAFLADISNMYQPKTISEKELISDGEYNVYGANGIIGKYNAFNHKEPQIAVACRGASCGALTMTLPYSWITGNAMVVSENKQFPYKEFLYYTLKHKPISYLTSGSAQPQLTRENMSIYPIKIPPQELLDKFENRAKSYRQKIIANLLENQKLRDLRDWLLPMLMNGQATISD